MFLYQLFRKKNHTSTRTPHRNSSFYFLNQGFSKRKNIKQMCNCGSRISFAATLSRLKLCKCSRKSPCSANTPIVLSFTILFLQVVVLPVKNARQYSA